MEPQNDQKRLALVVDDHPVNRKLLQALLIKEGYQTISAEDGNQAVELYVERQPDIVFMDAMMPVMDGFQATTRIKALAGARFVPVIFLTSLSEGDALVKCLEAGGDDFLGKPFDVEILRAKIKAMERISELSRTITKQYQKIESQNQILLREQVIAEQIYSRAVTADNVASKYIHSLLWPASVFSGDMLLTADCPDGKMHVLLGDFTGHGLAAAVGVLPTAEVFRAMTAKGFSAIEILSVINAKLHKLLPTGMFLCANFVVFEADMKSISIWNAGMPEVLVLGAMDGDGLRTVIKRRITSQYVPLGIISEIDKNIVPVSLNIIKGDRVLLCSDGLSEAENSSGEGFGMLRYEQAATETQQSFTAIVNALEIFCSKHPFADDVSLVEILCMPELLKSAI